MGRLSGNALPTVVRTSAPNPPSTMMGLGSNDASQPATARAWMDIEPQFGHVPSACARVHSPGRSRRTFLHGAAVGSLPDLAPGRSGSRRYLAMDHNQ